MGQRELTNHGCLHDPFVRPPFNRFPRLRLGPSRVGDFGQHHPPGLCRLPRRQHLHAGGHRHREGHRLQPAGLLLLGPDHLPDVVLDHQLRPPRLNATYYLDYQYNINYVAQGLSIYYSSTQLLWTFATSDALLDFYSAALYNSTCNMNVNKASLSLVMTTPVNGNSCTFTTSTLLPFDSFKSGTGIVSNSASGADRSEFASAL